MQVEMIDYTGRKTADPSDYAANILIFSKSTRLEMAPAMLDEIDSWPYSKKLAELRYMANTIPSSWEFVHYTFLIRGVTRAFTHQLVRTRTASYAQQTMRILDVSGWDYSTGPTIDTPEKSGLYDGAMSYIDNTYKELIMRGVAVEDARGVLPTNIHTNILVSASLRTLVEMVRKRSSPRTQGEYREFLGLLKDQMESVHNWTPLFFNRTQDAAARDLDKEILEIKDAEKRTRMIKLVDQLRSGGES